MNKGNTSFSTYLIAAITIGALCAIALMSVYGDLSAPTPASPEQFVETLPPAAVSPSPDSPPVAAVAPAPLATEVLASAPVVAVAAAPGEAPVAAAPAAPIDNTTQTRDELLSTLENWRKAWANRDVESYFSFYAADYAGSAESPAAWQAARRRIIDQAGLIDITLGKAEIELEGSEHATLTFPMNYRSRRFEDDGIKQLQFVRDQGKWRITREQFTAN